MILNSTVLDLDWSVIEIKVRRFIRDYVEESGLDGVVMGLSGGIDSSTVAALSALAIGGDKVLGLILPEQETYDNRDVEDAKAIAKKFRFKTQMIDITSALETIYKSIPIFSRVDKRCKGNVKSRTRAIFWYYYANRLHRLVCGSSDKSESMIGYFTKWGDIATDISPIMDLYKTQVRKLAHHIGIHERIITKPSSPKLWPGHIAEKEIGINYETLDLILYGLEHFMAINEISKQLDMNKKIIQRIRNRWLSMEHKRRMPMTTKIGYRTLGADFRLPQEHH
ncbi:MAG: NAD+ synthase [Candidatus Bathyarchaeota archaeon]